MKFACVFLVFGSIAFASDHQPVSNEMSSTQSWPMEVNTSQKPTVGSCQLIGQRCSQDTHCCSQLCEFEDDGTKTCR